MKRFRYQGETWYNCSRCSRLVRSKAPNWELCPRCARAVYYEFSPWRRTRRFTVEQLALLCQNGGMERAS